jgi:hypothetical protein
VVWRELSDGGLVVCLFGARLEKLLELLQSSDSKKSNGINIVSDGKSASS